GARRRGPGPSGRGGHEGVLDRLLGHVDVAEHPDQHGHGPAVLLAEDTLDLRGGGGGHAGAQSPGSPWKGRTSLGRVVASARRARPPGAPGRGGTWLGGVLPPASRAAPARAASGWGASTMVNPPMCSLPSV